MNWGKDGRGSWGLGFIWNLEFCLMIIFLHLFFCPAMKRSGHCKMGSLPIWLVVRKWFVPMDASFLIVPLGNDSTSLSYWGIMEHLSTTRSFCCLLGWSEPEAGVDVEWVHLYFIPSFLRKSVLHRFLLSPYKNIPQSRNTCDKGSTLEFSGSCGE